MGSPRVKPIFISKEERGLVVKKMKTRTAQQESITSELLSKWSYIRPQKRLQTTLIIQHQ